MLLYFAAVSPFLLPFPIYYFVFIRNLFIKAWIAFPAGKIPRFYYTDYDCHTCIVSIVFYLVHGLILWGQTIRHGSGQDAH